MGDNLVPQRIIRVLAFAGVGILAAASHQANAHAVAGNRVFPVTLTMDDPGVSDEASIPTFSWQRGNTDDGSPVDAYSWNFEYDKTITKDFGLGLNWGYNLNAVHGGKTAG